MDEEQIEKEFDPLELEGIGLECLGSPALALIVESDLTRYGELQYAGSIAFDELSRRDLNYDS